MRLAALCGWLLAIWAGTSMATDLYTGEVAVSDQSDAARKEATVEALKQVLVKVSGDPAAKDRPEVAGALADPERLVQAYYYRQDVDRSGAAPVLKLYYAASFEPRAITRLLSSSGLSQWARERPALMVWVAADAGGTLGLLGEGQLGPLLRHAGERGIELRPATTSEEERSVTLSLVERQSVDGLRTQAARSGVPGVLAGRVYSTADGYTGRFAYSDGERSEPFDVRGADLSSVLRAAADETANRLAARYAFAAADSEPVIVATIIRGIRNASDYARVQSYLASLSVIKSINMAGAAADTLTLNLNVAGGSERLTQIVGINDILTVAGNTSDGALVLEVR